jgi:signal transduction histidine kinase
VVGATIVLEEVTRLMRFDQLRSDMVATVAHELRTPLTSLRMAIYLCFEETVGPLTQKQAELLGAARDDTERLQTIVDELLDLSRIQAGRLELHRRQIPVEPLVRSMVDPYLARAAERELSLSVELPPDAGTFEVDADRLLLVFDNLLSNALRHTPTGGRITLAVKPSPERVRIEVSDTGPGISPEYRDAIFQKFFRGPGSTKGAGLGLYIAKEIVEAHGGRIGVDSAVGEGSTFWFELPRAVAALPAPQ